MNEELYRKLWAKSDPWHPLWCHLFDVAAACQALLPHFGSVAPLPDEWVCLLVGAHDIGKADDWFQNKDDKEGGLAEKLRAIDPELPVWSSTTNDCLRRFRHEARSAVWLREHLAARGWSTLLAIPTVTTAITGHHGDFAAGAYEEENPARKKHWDTLREALWKRLYEAIAPPEFVLERFPHAGVAGLKLSGLIVLSDWLASNDKLWGYEDLPKHSAPREYWRATQERAVEVVASLQFQSRWVEARQSPLTFRSLWPDYGNELRPSQAAIEKEVLAGIAPGLCLLEAPMGEGKTEGALYLASEWNRVLQQNGAYLALPTQATSNQMHTRYAAFLKARGEDVPRLVHGMAWMVDENTLENEPKLDGETSEDRRLALEWFRPLRRALLAPDGVGTVDQAMMAALHVKFGFLRLLGLGRKILVIDEVHAYDDYMTAILERLLEWCGAMKIGVILLSATLSHEQKKRLVAAYIGCELCDEELPLSRKKYPLLTFASRGEKPREVEVPRDSRRDRVLHLQKHHGLLEDAVKTAALARNLVQDGGCLCVLCNTVKSAQQVFEEVLKLRRRGLLKGTKLYLFHARFRASHRQRIERNFIKRFGKSKGKNSKPNPRRPKKSIAICSQVVEQSLDVDFDHFISQLAPIDLLLQRSGRLHRHAPSTRPADLSPTLHVLLPPENELVFGASEIVYDREILLRTLAYLHQNEPWNLPDDFRRLIEGVYARGELPNASIAPEKLERAANKRDVKRRDEAQKARGSLLPAPSEMERRFAILREAKAEAEGEGDTNTNFRAATRLGDDSRPHLILHDENLWKTAQRACRKEARPSRHELQALFENKVNLPLWWLRDATPQDGFDAVLEGDNRLRGHGILRMKNRVWKGEKDGRAFTIEDHKVLGLRRLSDQDERDEADAGITN